MTASATTSPPGLSAATTHRRCPLLETDGQHSDARKVDDVAPVTVPAAPFVGSSNDPRGLVGPDVGTIDDPLDREFRLIELAAAYLHRGSRRPPSGRRRLRYDRLLVLAASDVGLPHDRDLVGDGWHGTQRASLGPIYALLSLSRLWCTKHHVDAWSVPVSVQSLIHILSGEPAGLVEELHVSVQVLHVPNATRITFGASVH